MRRGLLAVLASTAVLVSAATPASGAVTPGATHYDGGDHSRLLEAMRLVTLDVNDGNTPPGPHGMDAIPGVIARTDIGGVQWAGAADNPASMATRQANSVFRAGSVAKIFTATVILQLVGDGRLNLTDDVFTLLGPILKDNSVQGCNMATWKCFNPPGPGAAPITVEQLLQHSSGIFNNMADWSFQAKVAAQFPNMAFTPAELVAEGASHGPQAAPGTTMAYSNTNYALLALIIEKVTGKPWHQALTERVVTPLGLTGTRVPAPADTVLPGPHDAFVSNLLFPRNGSSFNTLPAADQNASYGYGGGNIISTTADLITFIKALIGGQLLPPAQLQQMIARVNPNTMGTPAPALPPGITCNTGLSWPECIPNPAKFNVTANADAPTNWYAYEPWTQAVANYGLGLTQRELTCSTGRKVMLYGHNGAIPGSMSYVYTTPDAGHSIAFNLNGDWPRHELYDMYGILAAEFCPAP
ncbi:serine hydrolase domain-containing protein [Embleya sp. NBC_00896]|uniref:serine hydrolase domain-containing protein n=1 Tax=Embleya sp. NBC_00896 TaxID=2975961 RepID=UPI002F915211|nr:beta-lactamase family protein [Embleya sp. NBC_00896]